MPADAVLGDDELTAAAALAVEVVGAAARQVLDAAPGRVRTKKDPADLVTDVDVAVERAVVAAILDRFPGHRVIGEELGVQGAAAGAPTWYLDPVDGTTNYAHGIGWCSVSLALADARGPAVGVVADPYRWELFSAVRGRGARIGDEALRCPPASTLPGSVVATEWAGHAPWPGMVELLGRLSERYVTVRIMGSSALSIVLTAAGRAVGTVIGFYHDVDDLAAVLIAREAGAVVLGRDGTPSPGPDGVLVAAPGAAEELHACWTL